MEGWSRLVKRGATKRDQGIAAGRDIWRRAITIRRVVNQKTLASAERFRLCRAARAQVGIGEGPGAQRALTAPNLRVRDEAEQICRVVAVLEGRRF